MDPEPHASTSSRTRARPPTLRTISQASGAHVSTVSRVLNGTADEATRAASPALAARIRQIATDLGYRPNPQAAGLRTQRSRLVGVLVPRLSDLVLATIYEGVEEAAAEADLATFVTNTYDDPGRQQTAIDMMLARRVDGLIFGDAHLHGETLRTVAERGIPFVLVSRRAQDYPAVTCDDHAGGRLVAEHFLDQGFERPAVVAGQAYASTGVDRTRGFVERCREAGIEVPDARIVHSPFDAVGGHQAAGTLLDQRSRPDAIFAVNDFAAIGVLGALRDRGLEPGTDVAVAGYNDTSLARELPIPLTSVRSPMHDMGRRATALLAKVIAGEAVDSERLPPELVVRASSSR